MRDGARKRERIYLLFCLNHYFKSLLSVRVEAHRLPSYSSWVELPGDMWDLSSLRSDQIHIPCIAR